MAPPSSHRPAQRAEGLQPSHTFKYGMPVYGLAWPAGETFFLCGGGGSVASGIRNRVVGAQRALGHLLTDQVVEYDFAKNCPMKLAVLPGGACMVLAMAQGGVVCLDVEGAGTRAPRLVPASGLLADKLAADRGEVKCLSFNPRGDTLVLGGVDGSIKVLGWPSCEVKMHLTGNRRLADSIRDVTSTPGPRSHRFAVVLDNGTAEIWDWESGDAVCKAGLARGELRSDAIISMAGPSTSSIQPLPKGLHGARFAAVKYAPVPPPACSPAGDPGPLAPEAAAEHVVLYTLMNNRQGSWVVVWEQDHSTGMLSMLRHAHVAPEPSSCFDMSPCGQLLVVGTSQSAIVVLRALSLSVLRVRLKAHNVFCTGVVFSPDSTSVLSVSGDASATLTSVAQPTASKGSSVLSLVLVLLLVLAAMLAVVGLQQTGKHEVVAQGTQLLRSWGVPVP